MPKSHATAIHKKTQKFHAASGPRPSIFRALETRPADAAPARDPGTRVGGGRPGPAVQKSSARRRAGAIGGRKGDGA